MSVRWSCEAENMIKTMTGHKSMCDGAKCWKAWYNKDEESNETEVILYRRCTLEVHIVFESLLSSFHQQHVHLQQLLMDTDMRQRFHIVSSLPSSNVESPQLPPCDSRLAVSLQSDSAASEKTRATTEEPKPQPNKTRTLLFRKRQLFMHSRSGKEKLLKLFSSSSSQQMPEQIDKVSDSGNTYHEFYTVPSVYASFTMQQTMNASVAPSTQHEDIRYNSGKPTLNEEFEHGSKSSERQSSCPSPCSICTPSSSGASSLSSGSSLTTLDHEPVECKHHVWDKHTLPVTMAARNWRYSPANHVYATKVLSEMKTIMHEYCVWLEKVHNFKSESAATLVPRLSLEWPKNWTCTQSQ
ncbi:hypothetical protein EC973_002575 [Apophysomyces ossiformis]|uniref:Uncharacterized protein n=1 Tax=Apophysomyces ossiformis TaxID=679940 RepID=A0A8H7ENK9_9FUNG|nr:hypothetical protein EC973_002575 [Apophysomyces ossiformis]